MGHWRGTMSDTRNQRGTPPASGLSINYGSAITSVLALGAWVSTVTGHPAFGAIISDPATANAATTIVGVLMSGLAAFAPSVVKS